jgi:hypothetical protein
MAFAQRRGVGIAAAGQPHVVYARAAKRKQMTFKEREPRDACSEPGDVPAIPAASDVTRENGAQNQSLAYGSVPDPNREHELETRNREPGTTPS